jgi:hypothetical protein
MMVWRLKGFGRLFAITFPICWISFNSFSLRIENCKKVSNINPMKNKFKLVKLKDIVNPINRGEEVQPNKIYRQIGVRLWGEGAYERESIETSSAFKPKPAPNSTPCSPLSSTKPLKASFKGIGPPPP